jgi:hypothetical protein
MFLRKKFNKFSICLIKSMMGIIKWRCEIPNGSTQEYLCKYIYERRLFIGFVCHVEISQTMVPLVALLVLLENVRPGTQQPRY